MARHEARTTCLRTAITVLMPQAWDWSGAEVGRYALKPGERSEVRVDGAVGYSLRLIPSNKVLARFTSTLEAWPEESSPRLRPAGLREPSPLTGTMPPVARDSWAPASSLSAQRESQQLGNRSRREDAPRSELPKRNSLGRHRLATASRHV